MIIIKSKMITNFDNDCEQIYVQNKFTADNKVYNEWDEMRCKMINETIDDDKWDLQDCEANI